MNYCFLACVEVVCSCNSNINNNSRKLVKINNTLATGDTKKNLRQPENDQKAKIPAV